MRNLFLLFVLISFTCFGQTNWTASNTGLPPNSYVNDFVLASNGDIYIIVNSNSQGYLYKSANNGASWTNVVTNGLPAGQVGTALFINNTTLFLSSGGQGSCLYSSTDNGQNWIASNNGLPANSYVNGFALASNGDIYMVLNSSTQGYLYKSTNNGASWTSVTTSGLPSGSWGVSLFIKNNTLFLSTGGQGACLYSSTDNGQTWTGSNSGLPSVSYVNGFAATSNGDIYIVINTSSVGQLYKSTNNGSSWSNVATTGLPASAWGVALFINGNTMFLSSGGQGSYLYTSTITGSSTTGINEADVFNSVRLFPNPSRGEVNIISSEKIDAIRIINIVGERVYEQDLNTNQTSISIDADGVYFVTIITRGKATTEKLIVGR